MQYPRRGQIKTMSDFKGISVTTTMLLAGILASSISVSPAGAQSPASQPSPGSPAAAQSPRPGTKAPAPGPSVRRRPAQVSKSATMYYGLIWGVDSFQVKYAESGEIIRFSYRVIDPEKAKVLNDAKNEPSLIDPQAGVSLVVPSLPFAGKLRQASKAEAGKTYWMGFSNKGRYVKPGHRIIVAIGNFRAEGLVVE
jgi:hypothetical protein